MSEARQVKAWLRQARSDLEACTGEGHRHLEECHRRYLLQQACEKGLKAMGLVLWDERSADTAAFHHAFLHRHDPLSRLRKQDGLPRSLWALLRQLDSEIDTIDNAGLIRQVDGTAPSKDPMEISYRYPFVDRQTGDTIAPSDLPTYTWDAYQGNEMGVARAVGRLLDRVEARIRRHRSL